MTALRRWKRISKSYVLKGKGNQIPQGQIEWLQLSFFDIFEQYGFLEGTISNYPLFYEEYMNNEKVRKLLVDYLEL